MKPDNRPQPTAFQKLMEEADLSLEVVVLLVLGVFLLLFGILLTRIHTGALPYSPDGTYGLFLVLVSFQVIAMGKTPFGDLRRSWAVVAGGMAAAVLGMSLCFIPGLLTGFARRLVGLVLTGGGMSLFLQLVLARGKARRWMEGPRILKSLAFACGAVYLLSVALGLITLLPGAVSDYVTAGTLAAAGLGLLFLAGNIRWIVRTWPSADQGPPSGDPATEEGSGEARRGMFGEATLSLSLATLLLIGVMLTFLGLVLVPVNLGWIPFSPDGLQGLQLTLFAIQMMSLGDSPIGHYRRSWLMVAYGIAFVGLGAFSCIAPGVLTHVLRTLLALLNITAGVIYFARRLRQKILERKAPPAGPLPPVVIRLFRTQAVLNVVVIAFGANMLVPGLLPGLVNAAIIAANGLLLFRLASLLRKLEQAATRSSRDAGIAPGGDGSTG